jgi:predicted component of type VI protein secretion system
LAIKPTGLLVGRSPDCDVVLTKSDASRMQAIVFMGADGPCLSVLGKGPTTVNGEPVVHERNLAGGDRIELPGLVLEVLVEPEQAAAPRVSWLLRGPSGLFGVVRTPFTVGSAIGADLRLEGGPAVALRFHLADQLHVEAIAAIEIDGVASSRARSRCSAPARSSPTPAAGSRSSRPAR